MRSEMRWRWRKRRRGEVRSGGVRRGRERRGEEGEGCPERRGSSWTPHSEYGIKV